MVSLYPIILLSIVGAIEIFGPLVLLFWLHRRFDFKISSLIAGLAIYFVINYMVSNTIFSILQAIPGVEDFFAKKPFLGAILESAITALLLSPLFYLVIKGVRGGKMNIYDAAVLGLGSWMLPRLIDAAMQISSASVLRHARAGTLDKIANETYSEEMYKALIDSITASSKMELTLDSLGTLIAQIYFLMVTLAVCAAVFYIVKRHKPRMLWAIMGAHLVVLTVMHGSSLIAGGNSLLSFLIITVCGLLCGYFVYRFYQYYRKAQAELIQKKKLFKEEQHRKYQEELAQKYGTKKEEA